MLARKELRMPRETGGAPSRTEEIDLSQATWPEAIEADRGLRLPPGCDLTVHTPHDVAAALWNKEVVRRPPQHRDDECSFNLTLRENRQTGDRTVLMHASGYPSLEAALRCLLVFASPHIVLNGTPVVPTTQKERAACMHATGARNARLQPA